MSFVYAQCRQHHIDLVDRADVRRRRRQIFGWAGLQDGGKNRPWIRANPRAIAATADPDGWSGKFDFKYVVKLAALQTYYGDTTTPRLEPLVGGRIAGRRGAWINWKARNFNTDVDGEVLQQGRVVRWRNLWTDTNLRYRVGRDRLDKIILLKSAAAPTTFDFTARLPVGYTLEIANNRGRVLDEDGVEVMRLPAPWAKDSSTLNPFTVDGSNPIGVTMEYVGRVGPQGQLHLIRLTLDPSDMAGAVFPVRCDPTTVIPFGSIEDSFMWSTPTVPARAHWNEGGSPTILIGLFAGGSNTNRGLLRIDRTLIPENVTDARLKLWQASFASSTQSLTVHAHPIDDGTNWVVGTSIATAEVGAVDQTDIDHTATPWATPGGDFGASIGNMVLSAYTVGVDRQVTLTFDPAGIAVIEAWRTTARTSDGVALVSGNELLDESFGFFRSTDFGSNEPSVELDHTVAAAPIIAMIGRR